MKKLKVSKAEICRSYGYEGQPSNLRYQSPIQKGIYWWIFSLHTRRRDVEKYGTCISCGKQITVETSDAGHFMPANSCGLDLVFDERNVNAECHQCNAWDETHLLGYKKGLDKRYGDGTAEEIQHRRRVHLYTSKVTKWNEKEYESKINKLLSTSSYLQDIKNKIKSHRNVKH